jgi:Flp pilus assembly protein TadB
MDIRVVMAGIGIAVCAVAVFFVRRVIIRERELRRFNHNEFWWWELLRDDFRRFIGYRVARRRERRERGRSHEVTSLVQAGLDSNEAREQFYLVKDAVLLMALAISVGFWLHYDEHIAAVLTVGFVGTGYWGPTYWVWHRKQQRLMRLEREIPFLLEEICLGTTVGWEPFTVLSHLSQALGSTDALHPLVHELRRAQWTAATGATWSQGLTHAASRVAHPAISRPLTMVAAALTADQQRHELLRGVASDVHRAYLARLEGRTAYLPVVTLVLLSVLVIGFALLLHLPFL